MISPTAIFRQTAVPAWVLAAAFAALQVPESFAAAWAAEVAPGAQGFRSPYRPGSDAEILQEVPSLADPAVGRMRDLRARLNAAPHDLTRALELADAYVDYGREVGDAHYAGYAEAVIAPWLGGPKPAARVLVTQATILQYRHQFAPARALLEKALDVDALNAQAWLTLATLDMVQGDYAGAGKDCASVSAAAGLQFGFACAGNLRSYLGQATQGLALLRQAETTDAKVPVGYRAWIHGLLAESAERLGDWPLAEDEYRAALKLLPRDNFLLVAYADFLLDRGRAEEVLALLADYAQSDTAYLRLALAQAALHRPDASRYVWIMAARFEALALRGDDLFGREQARFALELQHDPHTALDLARRNWQVQRAPWDARVLLQAALAARQPLAAQDALEFLDKTHLQDPMIEPLARQLRAQLQAAPAAGQSISQAGL
jgi:Tfp pilus assembly protein PilF